VLDPYILAKIGYPEDSEEFKSGEKAMIDNNVNVREGKRDWTEGLTGVDLRWLPYNGGLGEE